jgi:hypothetical protein
MSVAMASSHVSALAGVLLVNGVFFLSTSPMSQAAWGWTLDPAADYTCEEGPELGCNYSYSACSDADFVCTVKAMSGKTCDGATTTIKCSADGGPGFQPKSGGECINVGGMEGHVKNSELMWVPNVECSDSSVSTVSSAPSSRVMFFTPVISLVGSVLYLV